MREFPVTASRFGVVVMVKSALICLLALASLACAANGRAEAGNESNNRERMSMIENGTKIRLIVGDTVIPAILNGSKPARALLAKLPYTVKLQRYEHDYCGVMSESLPYDEAELRSGWTNGDIAFAVDGNYFAILYKDEEVSQQFDGMVTMGALGVDPAIMGTLDRGISVRIELE